MLRSHIQLNTDGRQRHTFYLDTPVFFLLLCVFSLVGVEWYSVFLNQHYFVGKVDFYRLKVSCSLSAPGDEISSMPGQWFRGAETLRTKHACQQKLTPGQGLSLGGSQASRFCVIGRHSGQN